MGNRLWKHLGALLALAGLLLLVLGACQPAAPTLTPVSSPPPLSEVPEPTATTPATTILTVWHSWDSVEEGIIRRLLADYQGEHPGIVVRLQQVPLEQILPEYEEAVLAGEGPDLLVGRSHWIGRLAERQVISPLGKLLDVEYWRSFYSFALEGVREQGQLYAVPYVAETVALYYNRAFVTDPPTTTAALLYLAATWPGEGQAGLAFPMSFYNTVGYLYAFGGRLLDDQGLPALDTVEARAWLAWLQQVGESPGVVAADSYGQADALFKIGTVAMVVNGSWVLPDYIDALGSERLGVVPLPMLDQTQAWPTPWVGYRVLMVNPVCLPAHPEKTLELLRFLGGPSVQQLLAAQVDAIPTWGNIDLSSAPLLAGFVRQAELGRPRPVTLREQALWDPLENMLRDVTSGRVPIDRALQETQLQVEQILQEMAATTP